MYKTLACFAALCAFVAAAPGDFSIRRTYIPDAKRAVSFMVPAKKEHTVSMNVQNGVKSSSKYHNYGATTLGEASFGQAVSIPIQLGTQKFEMILDTGSSDTWIAEVGFKCVSPPDLPTANPTTISGGPATEPVPESNCAFGQSLYNTNSSTFHQIQGHNFNITYASAEFVTGVTGTESMTVGGLNVPNQEINSVNTAYWNGDNITSGIMGLAYPGLTTVYTGTVPATDNTSTKIEYNPFFTNLYENEGVAPLFSLALEYNKTNGLLTGGSIAFGGLPQDVKFFPQFASTPIVISEVIVPSYPAGDHEFTEYTIIPDGFIYGGNTTSAQETDMAWPWADSLPWPQPALSGSHTLAPTNVPMIIDSGTTLIYLPYALSQSINGCFDPPGIYNDSQGAYITKCTATAPDLGVTIAGQAFWMDAGSMVIDAELGNGDCFTGVTFSNSSNGQPVPLYILGDVFLNNILAVFDVGASQMHIAPRDGGK